MTTFSKKKFLFSGGGILLMLVLFIIFVSHDWYVNSKTKITLLEPFDQFDVGSYYITLISYLRFETTDDAKVTYREYCKQHGWQFSTSGASCQQTQEFNIAHWLHITIYKQFNLAQTVPMDLSLHDVYSIERKFIE